MERNYTSTDSGELQPQVSSPRPDHETGASVGIEERPAELLDREGEAGDAIVVRYTAGTSTATMVVDGGSLESGEAVVEHLRRITGLPYPVPPFQVN